MSAFPSDPTARMSLAATVQADEDITRRFLATCPGLQLGSVLYSATKRYTLITLDAPAGTVARLASSPLPVHMEGSCPVYPD
jgi:hypothetical protein